MTDADRRVADGLREGTAPDPVVALLTEIRDELRALRAALDRQPSLSRKDREQLAHLLPAIAGSIGSEPFTLRELVAHDAPALRVVLAGVKATQLGKLFSRAKLIPIAGYAIEPIGREDNAVIWRVLSVVS